MSAINFQDPILIENISIGLAFPTYFIADIAANHDGDLGRAKELIYKAKEAGADAVKFQHFLASKIVSDYGFSSLGSQKSHQANWKKPVFEIYKEYECNRQWTQELMKTSKDAEITFMTTPYDFEAVDTVCQHVPAVKIGSGDITWIDFLRYISALQKPVLLATGAADMADVERAVSAIVSINAQLVLMQCNTNYTGSIENFRFVNLNVLKTYSEKWPGAILGLSDHTPGHISVLGAIALGARVIEKHFTDDASRSGPDHPFSMTPKTWRDMVNASRDLEACLGDGIKRVEANEQETVILQRRAIRLAVPKDRDETLSLSDLEVLRPAPTDSIAPFDSHKIVGKKLNKPLPKGSHITLNDLIS